MYLDTEKSGKLFISEKECYSGFSVNYSEQEKLWESDVYLSVPKQFLQLFAEALLFSEVLVAEKRTELLYLFLLF